MSLRIAMAAACPYPAPQGSQVLVRDTALALRRRGHEVFLVVYGYGAGEDTADVRIVRSARIPGMRRLRAGPSLLKPAADAAMIAALRRLLRAEPIDVVHAHNYEGLLVALAARPRAPITYHAHNAMADELPYYFLGCGRLAAAGRVFDRALPRRADAVIAPHRALADYLVRCGCARERVLVLAPPCDPSVFAEATPSSGAEPPPVLYTGNLDAYQNLDAMARIMQKVRAAHPEARFHVATPVRREVRGADRVLFTPDFESVRRVLSEDAVVACPRMSWSGYPIKLLNAMAAGRAVAAYRSVAYPITHLEDGYVVEDGDEEAFAEAIIRLLTDRPLRDRLGRNARETIRRRHDPAAYAQAIEELYARAGCRV